MCYAHALILVFIFFALIIISRSGERASSLVVEDFRVAPPSPRFDSPRERIFKLG
jgi:hypothetical protein